MAWHACILEGKFLHSDEPLQESVKELGKDATLLTFCLQHLCIPQKKAKDTRASRLSPCAHSCHGLLFSLPRVSLPQQLSWLSCKLLHKVESDKEVLEIQFQRISSHRKKPSYFPISQICSSTVGKGMDFCH